MPGSRNSGAEAPFANAAGSGATPSTQNIPHLKVMLFVAPNFTKEHLQDRLSGLDFPLILIKDEPFSMIDLADVVLCASGTATRNGGLLEKPMVIMYKMNPMTAFLAKRFVRRTKYFGLINLVLDQAAYPNSFRSKQTRNIWRARLTD